MYIIITRRNMIVSGAHFTRKLEVFYQMGLNVFLLFWWLNSKLLGSDLFLFLQWSPIKLFYFDIRAPNWSWRVLDSSRV